MKEGKENKRLLVLFFCVAVIAAGCSVKTTPVKVPVTLPSAFSQSGTVQFNQKWWLDFEDPTLNRLIEQALNDNFSLQSSWDRLSQARATLRKSRSSFFPSVSGEVEITEKSYKSDGSTTTSDELTIGLSAQYEIDLWGRIRSSAEAARLDMEATAADLDAAAITLAAEVATTWFTLIEQSNEIVLLDAQIEANRKALEVISTRFKTGQVPLADVLQQEQLVESKKGEQASLVAKQKQSEHALAILVGKTPGSLNIAERPEQLATLSPLPDIGIPAQTILSRPDIRSALRGVEAANKRVAAAVADRFPSLQLTGTLNTTGNYIDNLFRDYLASLAAGLVGPIIDGGKRKAEVERTRAAASEQLNNYGQVVLAAIGELEDALIAEQQQYIYLESLQRQLDLSTRTVDQVRLRYLKGVENYERVLTAINSMQSLEQTMLKARRALLLNRIQLCKAMGSGWQFSEQGADYAHVGKE
ncbi:MAG: hypothetical protein CSA32_01645 [Desulfobulbus propionicus]|nr:MAG: hypothetical protein CSA32_01645 [Desulfobulbus propionicus]